MDINKRKLEIICSTDTWTHIIQHGVEKHIDKNLLTQLCDAEFRAKYLSTIISREYMVYYPSVKLVDKQTGDFLRSPSEMKQGHEYRKVYMNLSLDRITLSLCNEVYNRVYKNKIHKNCVSYQRGIGVSDIIQKLSNKIQTYKLNPDVVMGYKIDISKYFDSVNKETLLSALSELNTGSPVDEVIYDYYTCDTIIDEYGKQIEHYKSLAQGCALGSFLANYVLRDVDAALSAMNVIFYRYSDDIIIIGEDCHKAYEALVAMLKPKGLTLNPKKVQQLYYNDGFVFLGYYLQGNRIDLSPNRIAKYKKCIKDLCKVKRNDSKHNIKALRKGIRKLNSYLYAMGDKVEYGWADEVFKTVTEQSTIEMLDRYAKDHLRHLYTHKWNYTHNKNQVPNQRLLECGYVSMVHLFKARKCSSQLYKAEIQQWYANAV